MSCRFPRLFWPDHHHYHGVNWPPHPSRLFLASPSGLAPLHARITHYDDVSANIFAPPQRCQQSHLSASRPRQVLSARTTLDALMTSSGSELIALMAPIRLRRVTSALEINSCSPQTIAGIKICPHNTTNCCVIQLFVNLRGYSFLSSFSFSCWFRFA